MTTAPCCGVEFALGVEVALDVELGVDVESLRLVASEPPEHADNTAAKIASRTSRDTNTYCPLWACRSRPEPHRTTLQPAVERSAEPAICAEPTSSSPRQGSGFPTGRPGTTTVCRVPLRSPVGHISLQPRCPLTEVALCWTLALGPWELDMARVGWVVSLLGRRANCQQPAPCSPLAR
jgi:hypothetical protein